MKKNNYFFVILFFLVITYGMITLVREPKDISYTENRNLNKFQMLTIASFLDGTYQENLENSFLDQFMLGGSIKAFMTDKLSFSRLFLNNKKLCKNKYLSVGNGYYTYNCSKMLISKPLNLKEETEEYFNNLGKKYTELHKKVDTYYYYITTPENYNLENNAYSIDIQTMFSKYWNGKYKFDYLKINGIKDFEKYFYKTDHHWNHIGSYEGYKDIMNLFGIDNIIEPTTEHTFDFNFYGSSARLASFYSYSEPFTVYKFNIPEHKEYINGTLGNYGNENNYFNDIYIDNKQENHYASYYGTDYAEVIFDFNDSKKDNLLILGNSYTNSVNKLIASSFNKTHIIDLRHYKNFFGSNFNIYKYIEENNIDKVLVLMDIWFIYGEDYEMWGEK